MINRGIGMAAYIDRLVARGWRQWSVDGRDPKRA